jgi:hypothetical protein
MRQESRIQRDSFHFITRRYIAKRYSGGCCPYGFGVMPTQ